MKKSIAVLALTALSLSLVACGDDSSDTKVIESSAPTLEESNTSTDTTEDVTYSISYEGAELIVDEDIAPILEILGDPESYFESPSCAAEGIGKLYTYTDLEIETYPDGEVDRILYIRLKTDSVATNEGIDLSSSYEDVISAYGEADSEGTGSLTYSYGEGTLSFLFDGDSMISIEYDSPANQ